MKYLLRGAVYLYERCSGNFVTFTTRPQKASSVSLAIDDNQEIPQMAIILQGPIEKKFDFTIETIKLYKKNIPNTILVVSTWNDESVESIKTLRELNIEVVLSERPANRGPRNINLQIVTTRTGIQHAKKLGAKYICKTRTDQRFYAPQGLIYLYCLLKLFPYSAPFNKQKERIIICSHETLVYRPYGATDQLQFGALHDLLLYWSAPLDERNPGVGGNPNLTVKEAAELRTCETYLETEYMKKIDRSQKNTLLDSIKVYQDHFIVADKKTLDLYWPKYEHYIEERFSHYEEHTTSYHTFRRWLVWQHLGVPTNLSEKILNLHTKDVLPKEFYK